MKARISIVDETVVDSDINCACNGGRACDLQYIQLSPSLLAFEFIKQQRIITVGDSV
jgi:hypothetical protein